MQECSLFFIPSPAFIVCRLLDAGHSDQCEVISHCNFNFHFSNNEHLFNNWQRINFQNIQASHTTQCQQIKQPNQKVGKWPKQTLLQRRHRWLPAILILSCASSSLAFCMMYSAYKLNKHGDNTQPLCIPFPIWNQSVVPCSVLLLLDLHIDFSGGREGGLVFPSLEEFSSLLWSTQSKVLV